MMMSRMSRPMALAVVCGLTATAAQAQLFGWAAAVSGDWDVAGNWNPAGGPPLNPGQSAMLGLAGPYTVTINLVNPDIDELFVQNPNAVVNVTSGNTLSIAGPFLNNEGTIRLNPQVSSSDSVLDFAGLVNITGGGEIRLLTGGDNSRLEGAMPVTHGPSHLIRGYGEIRLPFVNLGEIRADASIALGGASLLLLTQDDIVNDGLLSAAANSTLDVTSITIDQTGGGTILADQGTVNLNLATVLGGTLDSMNGGIVHSNQGVTTVDDVTNLGTLEIDPATTLALATGGLANEGIIQVNAANSSSDAVVEAVASCTIDGGGELHMVSVGNNSRIETAAGQVLTHSGGHTIRGVGQINGEIVNLATIDADVSVALSGTTLELQTNAKTNNGTMGAQANSILRIFGITIDQTDEAPGILVAHDLGTIQSSGGTILGGEILTTGTGVFETTGGTTTLDDVLLNGNSRLNAATSLSVTGGALSNNGLMLVNEQNSGSDAVLVYTESGVLGGSGEVRLRSIDGNSRIETAEEQLLTHTATHTISGSGQINAAMLNEGTVVADTSLALSGNRIILSGNDKDNGGVMAAATDSFLDVTDITIDQADTGGGPGMLLADGGTIRTSNAMILEGSMDTTGAGAFETEGGTTTLHNVTLNLPSFLDAATGISVTGGGLTNNGLMQVNNQNSGSDAVLEFTESGMLGGSGEVRLRTIDANSRIETAVGQTMTNGPDHTISGAGQINAAMTNLGTMVADTSLAISGDRIMLSGNDKTNQSLIRAAADSAIDVTGITLDQSGEGATGMLVADGGEIRTSGGTIVGGEILGVNGGVLTTLAATTLDGVLLNADSFLNAGDTLTVLGATFTNNGLMVVNPQNSGADSVLFFDESCTLDGTGEINLFTIAGNSQMDGNDDILVINGENHTVSGDGQINVMLLNEGTLAPGNPDDPTKTLDGNDDIIFAEQGVYEVSVDGTADSVNAPSSTVTLGGTVEVFLEDDFVPGVCDSFTIVTAGTLEGSFDELVAPNAGPELRFRLFQTPTTVELRSTCLADVNADCELNVLDFVAFQGLFQEQSPEADCNEDGLFNILDFVCFQADFVDGCPG